MTKRLPLRWGRPLNDLQEPLRPAAAGERLLFMAVVGYTIMDATKLRPSEVRDKARAVVFASVGVTAEHFEDLCYLAGIEDPDYVRDEVRRRIEEERPLSRHQLFRALDLGAKEDQAAEGVR